MIGWFVLAYVVGIPATGICSYLYRKYLDGREVPHYRNPWAGLSNFNASDPYPLLCLAWPILPLFLAASRVGKAFERLGQRARRRDEQLRAQEQAREIALKTYGRDIDKMLEASRDA